MSPIHGLHSFDVSSGIAKTIAMPIEERIRFGKAQLG